MVPPPPFKAGRRLGGASAPLACQPRVLLGDPGEASSVDSSWLILQLKFIMSCHVMFAHFESWGTLNH